MSKSLRMLKLIIYIGCGILLAIFLFFVAGYFEQRKARKQMNSDQYTLKGTKTEIAGCISGSLFFFGLAAVIVLKMDTGGDALLLGGKVVATIMMALLGFALAVSAVNAIKWSADIYKDYMVIHRPFHPAEEISFSSISSVDTSRAKFVVYVDGEKKFSASVFLVGRAMFVARMKELGKQVIEDGSTENTRSQ